MKFSSNGKENEWNAIMIKSESLNYDSVLSENNSTREQSKLAISFNKDNNYSLKYEAFTLKSPIIKIKKLHWCSQCRREFETERSLKDHINTHSRDDHKIKQIKSSECSIGEKDLTNSQDLNSHSQICKKTKKITKQQKENKQKQRKKEQKNKTNDKKPLNEKPYACETCGKRFIEPSILKIHMAFHTGEKPFECGNKKKTMYRINSKINEKSQQEDEGPYKCTICSIGLQRAHTLKAHMLSHLGVKPYECNICHLRLSSKPSLKSHIETHENIKSFICDICFKSFRKLDYLKYHKRIHLKERPYKCDICKKGYSRLHDVRTHMSYHTGIRPYECKICKKGYLRKTRLTQHMYIHENEKSITVKKIKKSFTCDICLKSYRRLSELTAHKKRHLSHKSYKCEICEMKFKQHSDLVDHSSCHIAKPFECDICNKKFEKEYILRIHLKTHQNFYKYSNDEDDKINNQEFKLESEMEDKENGDFEFQEETTLFSIKKELFDTLNVKYGIEFQDIKQEPEELMYEINEM